jgi:hypothetical protein
LHQNEPFQPAADISHPGNFNNQSLKKGALAAQIQEEERQSFIRPTP